MGVYLAYLIFTLITINHAKNTDFFVNAASYSEVDTPVKHKNWYGAYNTVKSNGRKFEPAKLTRQFHSIKPKFAKNCLKENISIGNLSEEDGKFIEDFVSYIKGTRHISVGRANKFTYTLAVWKRYLPPFREATIGDLYKAITEFINEPSRTPGQPHRHYKKNTQRDYIGLLKRFYEWMIKQKYSSIDRDDLREIKVPSRDTMTVTGGDLITREELSLMVKACYSAKDRAILMMMYEGALRPIEVAHLKWRDLFEDHPGITINVNEKTGKARRIPLAEAKSYLLEWKNDYPGDPVGDAPVFLTAQYLPLTYPSLSAQVQKIAKRAGITRKISLRLFRHSRITELKVNGMSESAIKMIAWGHLNTNMFATYVHLTEKDVNREFCTMHGIKSIKRTEDNTGQPKTCPSCSTINGPTTRYCYQCGFPLDEELITDRSHLIQMLNTIWTTFTPQQLETIQKIQASKMHEKSHQNEKTPA